MTTALSIRNLWFSYDKQQPPVVSNLDVDLETGTVNAVLGANGVGKTTLLLILLGLYEPDRGDLLFFGKPRTLYPPEQIRRFIGMVSQNETVPFDLSVQEYVLLGRAPHLGLFSMPGPTDRSAAQKALSTVGMSHLSHHAVTRLSSGEKQLVHTARALAQNPDILLLDEPCAHLDLINARQMLFLIRDIAAQGRTVIFTTHDPNAAIAIADRVVLLKKGELIAFGGIEDTITRALLSQTYNNPVEVVHTENGPFVPTI